MNEPKYHPMIFSGPMVRAILGGRKTMTRRVVKPNPLVRHDGCWFPRKDHPKAKHYANPKHFRKGWPADFSKYQPGDRIWVREAFRLRADQDHKKPSEDWWKSGAWYAADSDLEPSGCAGGAGKLRSPIHMPRWASRITLEVTAVRIERVQEISEEDSLAEGVDRIKSKVPMHRDAFYLTWTSLHGNTGPKSWEANPWVAVIEFERAEK